MNSFNTLDVLESGDGRYQIHRVNALTAELQLPFSIRILLENLLRHEDGVTVTRDDIQALLDWNPEQASDREIQFRPARVLMQDFTGVPAVVDLAAMRDAMYKLGGRPEKINPLQTADLVIDHSVQVDHYGAPSAFGRNAELEFQRNRERYAFLKWGQSTFSNFRVVPPDTGIVHQVNLEKLAGVVLTETRDGAAWAFPDTLVGTDSHTTMINGVGILGWGVGGIEAEASMLGQPLSMLIPQVVGVNLTGTLPSGVTATDLVLTIVERLRKHGVVGKLVEFFGSALAALPLGDRATIANMAPEYGATCGLFPIDQATLDFLRLSGRASETIALVENYARIQGFFHDPASTPARYTSVLDIDLSQIAPSLAGPKRPQDRVALTDLPAAFTQALQSMRQERSQHAVEVEFSGYRHTLRDGCIAIAAITSCTNTSNPSVMVAAGLLAQKAVARGLRAQPWVKTSLGPGSLVVTRYLQQAGLMSALEQLGFHNVGYGCTTCIGNSGPLHPALSQAAAQNPLTLVSVLSGNRNFEGRVHPEVRMNYLASPPLVVAYAIAGHMDFNPVADPLGHDATGQPVMLSDIWPSTQEVADTLERHLRRDDYVAAYAEVFQGSPSWQALSGDGGLRFVWQEDSTYIRHPPYFAGMTREPQPPGAIAGARILLMLGDSVTTDHISPAGSIKADSPAGQYLKGLGVTPADFNSYGSRRGNHEVMVRGTFANIRLRNLLAPGTEGGVTRHQPSGDLMTVYDAAMRYGQDEIPLMILAGKEYGSGSSRDWAAKGPRLLGVRAVIAESFERIHRTNLVCMGILPLEFLPGDNAAALGLDGTETYEIHGLDQVIGTHVRVSAVHPGGRRLEFSVRSRVDTPNEAEYYRHGSILHFVLRRLLEEDQAA